MVHQCSLVCTMARQNFFLVHLTFSFHLKETRSLSDIFIIQMSDWYPEPGHWWQFGEQLASTSISPFIRIFEASTSGASCNQKDWQEKILNHDSARHRDLNQRWFCKQALFKQSLCLLHKSLYQLHRSLLIIYQLYKNSMQNSTKTQKLQR